MLQHHARATELDLGDPCGEVGLCLLVPSGGVPRQGKQGGITMAKQRLNAVIVQDLDTGKRRTICRYCVGGNRDLIEGQNPSPKKPAVAAYVCADCGRVLEWVD